MPNPNNPFLHLFFLALMFCAAVGTEGSRVHLMAFKNHQISSQESEIRNLNNINWRRLMIGSVAPVCTFNECKGCKYKCRAEQVPVEGNDPMHSPYHYKCVCHI